MRNKQLNLFIRPLITISLILVLRFKRKKIGKFKSLQKLRTPYEEACELN